MKTAFKSTDGMKSYMAKPKTWQDGDVRDLKKDQAEHLMKRFPLNFFPAGEFAARQKAEADARAQAEADKAAQGPAGDPKDNVGDTSGTDLDNLDAEGQALYASAAEKIDKGEELTDEERAAFDLVEGEPDGS